MIIKPKLSRYCLWVLAIFISSFTITPFSAQAVGVIADTPCDGAYYESLSARAWLEAQREITQNQNIILKPDSVFEYTCFDQLVWELADHADEMLSETTAYGSPLGATSMDNALNRLVMNSLHSFVGNNYGGYSGLLGGHPAALSIKHTVPNAVSGSSSYSCDIMERVWHAAKCINFITDSEYDGFYTFDEYAVSLIDKRHLPTVCSPITGNWAANLTTALTSGPWTNDPVKTYLEETTPQNCTGGNCKCSEEPIPTGIEISGQSPGPATYEEKICLQPGCRYHPGGFPLISTSAASVSEGCYGR